MSEVYEALGKGGLPLQLTLTPERAQQLRVWILVPAAGDLIHATFSTHLIKLLGLLRTHGIWYTLNYLPGDSLVTRARNNLADIFMSASTDDDNHFSLWLDCDILFNPEDVLALLALDLDFVAAPYSKKGLHMDRMVEAAKLGWPNDRVAAVVGTPNVNWLINPVRTDIPMPVLEAGSGFWLVKRKVYRMMQDALPEIRYKRAFEEHAHYGRDFAYDFFKVGVWPDTGEYLSEDWWFSRTWRKLGGTLHCCFWMKTHHIGPYLYPCDMAAIADLLTATGGFINAETRPNKETLNAPAQIRTSPSNPDRNGNHNGDGTRIEREWGASDLQRALAAAGIIEADEAAGPRDPGPVGDRAGD